MGLGGEFLEMRLEKYRFNVAGQVKGPSRPLLEFEQDVLIRKYAGHDLLVMIAVGESACGLD